MRIYSTTPPAQRFWAKVRKDGPTPTHQPELGPCWVWTGPLTHGYGQLHLSGYGRNREREKAHRFSWSLHYGPIPAGLWVLHRCDNRACVRPDHLFLGTLTDNNKDMWEKGRGVQARLPGASNPQARLRPEQVAQIRQHYAGGAVSQAHLAASFGISQTQVSRIVRGETWTER